MSAAEAKLLEIALQQKRDEIKQGDAQKELETVVDDLARRPTEVKTLQMLSQIYNDNGRYFESLQAARTRDPAASPIPTARAPRRTRAQALFAQIFLSQKGDDLPPIEALSMFYEFRELTPIGRRGDEMIRRLADRLVAVDLLDQAAELLQYQVDKRLEGSARAQVASKLAMVYLAGRKPDLAITALRATRIADLSGELRQQRLLLEARAQSDVGRHDLALDIVSNISGREAIRLRSDIYWAARRWREASEQIELYYGERWRDFKPLNPAEKSDVIRAVVGYALAEDAIGMARFREKYAPLMSGESDTHRLRPREQAARGLERRIRRDRQDGGQRRHAGRIPARDEDPFPRCFSKAAAWPIRTRPARCRRSPRTCGAPEVSALSTSAADLRLRMTSNLPDLRNSCRRRPHEQARQDRGRTDRDGAGRAEGSCRSAGRNRRSPSSATATAGSSAPAPTRRRRTGRVIPEAVAMLVQIGDHLSKQYDVKG